MEFHLPRNKHRDYDATRRERGTLSNMPIDGRDQGNIRLDSEDFPLRRNDSSLWGRQDSVICACPAKVIVHLKRWDA